MPDDQWQDWCWQIRNRITTAEELVRIIPMTPRGQRTIKCALDRFRFAVPPYYASLIDLDDPECPIRLQAIPGVDELSVGSFDIEDPLNEEGDAVAPGMTHRYPDRVLWVIMHECAMLCRHCTRKRKAGDRPDAIDDDRLDAGIAYLSAHPEIRDVLFSGADPLLLSDERLDHVLGRVRGGAPSVEMVRLGTRVPVTVPQRITPELVAVLQPRRRVDRDSGQQLPHRRPLRGHARLVQVDGRRGRLIHPSLAVVIRRAPWDAAARYGILASVRRCIGWRPEGSTGESTRAVSTQGRTIR